MFMSIETLKSWVCDVLESVTDYAEVELTEEEIEDIALEFEDAYRFDESDIEGQINRKLMSKGYQYDDEGCCWFLKKCNHMNLKIEGIEETTFENNTYWVIYSLGEHQQYMAYEIFEGTSEDTEEGVREKVIDRLNLGIINASQWINKPLLNTCSKKLQKYVQYATSSENEMFFVEYDELESGSITKQELETIEDEVEKLGLHDYITFDDGYLITFYGGIATQFLF